MKNYKMLFALAFVVGALVLLAIGQNIWVYLVSYMIFAGLYIWQISFLLQGNDVQGERAIIPVAIKFFAAMFIMLLGLLIPAIRENILAYVAGFFIPNIIFIIYAINHQKEVGGAASGRN